MTRIDKPVNASCGPSTPPAGRPATVPGADPSGPTPCRNPMSGGTCLAGQALVRQTFGGLESPIRESTSRRRGGDAGTVTAETAVVLPVLLLVTFAAMTGIRAAATELACQDAARAAARAAARDEPPRPSRRPVDDSDRPVLPS